MLRFKHLVIFTLYILFSLSSLLLLDPKILDLQSLIPVKYVIIISLFFLISFYTYKNSIYIKYNLLIVLIVVILAVILIPGVLFSVSINDSLFRSLFALLVFIILFASVGLLGAKEVLEIIYKFLFILTIFTLLLTDLMLLIEDTRAFEMGNLKSFFCNANTFGSLVGLFLLPVLLLRIFETRESKKLYFYIFIFINLLILFWFIKSRAALLSFFVFTIIIIYYKYFKWDKKRIKNSLLIFFFLLILGIVFLINGNVQNYLQTYFLKREYSEATNSDYQLVASRAELWFDRIEAIKKRPLVGWGYGVNSIEYDNNYNQKQTSGKTEKGNSILAIFEEFGFLFGSLLIFIISFIIVKIYKKIKIKDVQSSNLLLVTSSILVASLININFESWLLYFGSLNALLFWFFLVAMINFPKEKIK